MIVTLKKSTYGLITLERRDDATLKATCSYRFNQQKHYTQAAKLLGVPVAQLMERVDEFRHRGNGETLEWDAGNSGLASGPGTSNSVFVRAINSPATEASAFVDFRIAVETETSVSEPVIYWSDRKLLCAVDVDYHGVEYAARPTVNDLELTAERVSPRPFAYWATHGRGLRLMYAPMNGFSAEELAAVAVLSVADPRCRVELTTITRHPLYKRGDYSCGPVHWTTQSVDLDSIKQLLGTKEVDDAAVTEWLSARGLVLGNRYPHSHCPVAPSDKEAREPVQVNDNGIYCHLCAGTGTTHGSRKPGWFSFASLLQGNALHSYSNLGKCVHAFAHWDHVRFILEECQGLRQDIAPLVYSACLKVVHGADPRIPSVFRGRNLIRLEGAWATLKGEYYVKDIRTILSALPAAQYVDSEGAIKTDPEKVARLDQTNDLTDSGYPALTPIWGHRIYTHRLPLRDQSVIPVVLQTRELSHESMASHRPKYVKSYDVESAWRELEGPFPGIDRKLITLLIAARGCVEGQIGLPPFFFFTGPSGAAKTSHVLVAAAIIGDKNRSVVLGSDEARARAGILEAKSTGTFCTFNEATKNAKQSVPGITPLDFILNLTADSTSHKLYVGPVPLGVLPVCTWTDTYIAEEIKSCPQIARRLIHCHLPSRLDWVKPIKDYGINQIHLLRTLPEFVTPCNVILSHVIDTYFDQPRDIFDIAESLGFYTLENSPEAVEARELLKRFYAAVQACPVHETRRWPGGGWKLIDESFDSELLDLWNQLRDEGGSRKCSETDWGRLVGSPTPISFETRTHGRKTVVRFT